MATTEGNRKIASIRGAEWREKLVKGKLEAQMNPTNIKLARAQKLIPQTDLAESIGVSLSTYGQIERGIRTVTKETASKLAKHLGASMSSLFKPSQRGKFVASRSHQ
jgi:DNA-binding XRE family transcriptional regulator